MERVRMQIGVEEVWSACNKLRKDDDWRSMPVTVGVLDTGCLEHPDLLGRIAGFRDFVRQKSCLYDDNGHGTHVCGIIGGSGKMSGGQMRGMAPGCRFVVGKVLDRRGDGMSRHMLQALDWILEMRKELQIRVLNISVGIGEIKDKKKEEALRDKIEELWSEGITVVCAAGNKGPEEGSISAICGSAKVITVGCHDGCFNKDNPKRCATYSGRGRLSDNVRKPDLVAPGTQVHSCNAFYRDARNYQPYVGKSGTSMATPIVTGAVALLLQKYPDMSNEDVRRKLTYTATDLGEPWNLQGWGMINVKKMLEKY